MKDILFKSMLLLFVALTTGFSCGKMPDEEIKEPEGEEVTPGGGDQTDETKPKEFGLTVKSVSSDYVEIEVSAPSQLEMAYKVTSAPQAMAAAVLFKENSGSTRATVTDGQVLKITENIVQDATHYIYAAAILDAKDFSDVIELEFKTEAYVFDELVTVVDTYYDGFKVHITVPQETKDRGNVIRYGSTSLAWYNLLKNSKGGDAVDLNAVVANGNPYGNYVKNDSTIVMDNWNVVLLDKNGEPVLDSDNQQIDIHDPITSGEPTIFLAGECRWGSPDEYAAIMGFNLPERDSYSIPLFDWKTGWTGAFQKKEFFAKQPSLLDAKVIVEIPEDEIDVTDAMVYFTMEEGVERYFYMILDNATYNQVLSMYLDNHEEWFQWFLTSYIAFYEWGVLPLSEDGYTNAASSFIEPLTGGETYHVLVTAMGDEEGATQSFVHETFKAKEKTKRPPVIEVTAIENGDPYNATFNIKAPDKDVVGAYWACNYAREFELMFNAKYTYPDILKGNYSFTSAEMAKVNSDAGLTVSYPTLDGEVTRMAVYGCNDEYTFNNIDANREGAGWADYQAPMYASDKTPVSSPLFEALAGEWTATATIVAKEQLEDGSTVSRNIKHSSKVVISTSAPELPETLDESVYALYPKKTRDDVDGMFEELHYLSEQFTEYRLKGQNRLLCNGFIDFDYFKDPGRMTYRSPYELFTATNYNSVDVPMLMYDFGPKWFLEVLQDGSVIVPFHSMYMPPMHNWPGYSYYVGGVGGGYAFYDATDLVPGFPVEISADMETITIKPIVTVDEKTGAQSSYYMNALGINPQSGAGELEIVATIISDIVLKKGWTEPSAPAKAYASAPSKAKAVTVDGAPVKALPKARVYKSMSDFSKIAPRREYRLDETPNVVTMDMVNKTSEMILNHFNVE